ncbi:WRKY transcription factor 65-like [Tripterygium wilfordii]|uniref:WRKY transcription factor 65-like n=1 Tax=Tripterygium wilfordii TaxID=458696 RepID=A0A7J7CQ88_TRIWF|nr:probable WRKY transcription factor 65 [Tripterygium wilfordii]KAF5736257.1 WRKY transcription factor 65-like [Tripterygium wilfordii]
MKSRLQIIDGEENYDNSTPESSLGSPTCSDVMMINTTSRTSSTAPSPKRRRGVQKRVVSVPIKEVEASRLKGETPPPSDSWAWRKYGQKPIKGSPYPRGYYRCSSSKGCPARKQVERSSVDPTMLVVTYSSDHNHPWPPPSRNHHNSSAVNNKPTKPGIIASSTPSPEDKFPDLPVLMTPTDEFAWFGEMETTSSTILDSPVFADKGSAGESDVAMLFPMGEEEDSLFADLGELPECSMVFRHRDVGSQVEIC